MSGPASAPVGLTASPSRVTVAPFAVTDSERKSSETGSSGTAATTRGPPAGEVPSKTTTCSGPCEVDDGHEPSTRASGAPSPVRSARITRGDKWSHAAPVGG